MFKNVRSDSIDYAVMEKHQTGKVLTYDGKWSDIGSFKSIYDTKCELSSTTIQTIEEGRTLTVNSVNSLIINTNSSQLVSIVGVDNLVVITTNETVMIVSQDKCQDVKKSMTIKLFYTLEDLK